MQCLSLWFMMHFQSHLNVSKCYILNFHILFHTKICLILCYFLLDILQCFFHSDLHLAPLTFVAISS